MAYLSFLIFSAKLEPIEQKKLLNLFTIISGSSVITSFIRSELVNRRFGVIGSVDLIMSQVLRALFLFFLCLF